MLVQQLVNDYIVKPARRCFPVTEDGQVGGIVTLRHIAGVPQEQWGALMVGQVMRLFRATKQVPTDQDLWSVMELMAAGAGC